MLDPVDSDWNIEIVRSDRRTVGITIKSYGEIVVHAPAAMSDEKIAEIVKSKEKWISRHMSEIREASVSRPPLAFRSGEQVEIFGEKYTLAFSDERLPRVDGKHIVLPQKCAKIAFEAVLKKFTLDFSTAFAEIKAAEMGVKYNRITVNSARSRWGSCDINNDLRFTFRLALLPKDLAELVIIHELAHVKHKNHGKEFWAFVAAHCPDYKSKSARLSRFGYLTREI